MPHLASLLISHLMRCRNYDILAEMGTLSTEIISLSPFRLAVDTLSSITSWKSNGVISIDYTPIAIIAAHFVNCEVQHGLKILLQK